MNRLPKKNVTGCQARRPSSSLTDPIWTLAGILSHRYKSNKWIQLNLCLLTNNSRLVAYKTGHSMTPSLALFLYGSTGIYSGRDSGMEHVIKIVHSSREIIVLAAPTEEQALIWVRQINQYSQGSIPTEVCSFLPHLNVPNSINTQTSPTTVTNNNNKNTTDRNFTSPQLSSCNNRSSMDVTDLQADSEFLTLNKTICTDSIPSVNPTKNPSFDNRNVGLLISSCEINSQRNRKAEKSVTNHRITTPIDDVINTNDSSLNGSGMTDSIHHCLSSSVVIPSRPLSSMTLSSLFDSSTISIKQNSRRSSLISSMRRKVESFSSKRRIRKSLPQSLQSSTNGYSNLSQNEMVLTGHRRMLSDGQWKNNLSSSEFSSVQCLQQQSQHMISSPPLPPPPAACVWDSSGNSGKGFGWSHLVSAGVRFLNQHTTPTVIPSSTNNGRPRSVRYDSAGATSDLFSSQICLTSNYGPLLDLNTIRSHSTAPYTIDASIDNHIVISGDAFISIPDQVPWTIKWCCLKLNCLEIYQNSRKDYYSKISQNSNEYIDENYNWPIFSLPLNSDKVELGLAGCSDKRHSSAIRLAVPTECTTPLLFDAIDKSQMGSWIRGFIQALGLVGPIDVAQQKNYSLHRMSSIGPKNTVLLHPPCVSVQENHIHSVPLIKNHTVLPLTTTMNPLTSTSLIHRIPNSIMETSQTSMYYSDIHDNDVDDDVNDLVDNNNNSNNPFFVNVEKQETSSSSSNMVIYDEVCPPQPSFATTTTTANTPVTSLLSSTDTTRNPPNLSKRRWSSPLLIVDSCTKFPGSFYLSNIESNNALLTNNNSNNNNNSHNKSSNWHIIPPPSRRLLAQPLPPLPSVGPSTCESMAGTITSDGSCTSSNITPDDFVGCVDDVNDDNNGYQDEDERVKLIRSINMNLETDNYPLYWSKKDKTSDSCNLPSSTLNRRYASMSSLEYSVPFNESSTSMYDYNNNNNSSTNDQKKPKRKDGNKSILKQFLSHKQCHSWINNNEDNNNKAENNNNSTLDIMNNSGSNSMCTALMTDGIYSSPLCTAFTFISESDNSTLHKADSDHVTSDTTNTTCTTTTTSTCTNVFSNDGNNDNISRRNSEDEVSLWNVKAENFLCSRDPALVEYMQSSKLISARRCVSCLTGSKPTVLQKNSNIDGIPISSSTLPVRCGSDDTATAIMNTEAIASDPVLCQKLNKHWNRNSYSSNSSRTATSSGVALTAEFSSPGSGGTTRPSSLAMPNYHPHVTLVEEEQTNIEVR
ncbi:unnamed protein product [Schistosoma margrebowiei]|uniref:Uncharacterized protein n=1 Tax=Schistosoma margrebowiei TaxID=48269 RepID=A0A183LPN0_9TREM|nr:unnamed protein product [Schistosoma margrebowiei]